MAEKQEFVRSTYLGDGVYASFDGYHIWLKTEGSWNKQEIALEPSVIKALNEYNKQVEEAVEKLRERHKSK